MKTSTIGIVSAAILMVVAGVGIGIAQAGGTDSDSLALTPQEQVAVEQYNDFLAGPIDTGNMLEPTNVAETQTIGESMEWQTVEQESSSSPYVADHVETGNMPEPSDVAETRTIGDFMEWQVAEQDSPSNAYAENQPVLRFEDESQMESPIGTGNLPEMGDEDSSVVGPEWNMSRVGEYSDFD